MRGDDQQPEAELFICGSMEERIPADHPLRRIRPLVDEVLRSMSGQFASLYAAHGRPSIPPERLQMGYNLLFRWFVGMDSQERAWNHAVFSKNRERLLNREVAQMFFTRVKEQAAGRMSDEHFTVDGTLIEAWAGHNSFRPKQGGGGAGSGGEFRGEQRRNDTHASRTDPESRLYRKCNGQEAKLAYLGHVLAENRNGLIAAAMATQADGRAERDAARLLVQGLPPSSRRRTLGADKAYDSRDFVHAIRELGFTPHVNQNTTYRRSAIAARNTAPRLLGQFIQALAGGEAVRLDEVGRLDPQRQNSRAEQARMAVRIRLRRLQPAPHTQAPLPASLSNTPPRWARPPGQRKAG